MIDAQKQSEIIAAKAGEIYYEACKQVTILNLRYDIDEKFFKPEIVKEAIHGAVASGYLLCLQYLTQQTPMQTAPEIKDEIVRGM